MSGCKRPVTKNAISWATVIVPPDEVDRIGLHVANIEGMRRGAGTASTVMWIMCSATVSLFPDCRYRTGSVEATRCVAAFPPLES